MPSALTPFAAAPPPRTKDRSPHPYARRGNVKDKSTVTSSGSSKDSNENYNNSSSSSIAQHVPDISVSDHSLEQQQQQHTHLQSLSAAATTTSESGTEADDERPQPLKALPAPNLRPRKGFKGEAGRDRGSPGGASPLLTPSQLDSDGRRLSKDYFALDQNKRDADAHHVPPDGEQEKRVESERRLFQKRRRAERVRRIAEGILLAAIGVAVVCGHSVGSELWKWHRAELFSQVAVVALLIAVYPLRVVSQEAPDQRKRSLLDRFRVPPSFDPASVLYPAFLPTLVALSLLPTYPALLLPNIILGLASLPPRLFPASSRIAAVNTLHWMVSIVPLLSSENTTFPSKLFPPAPYKLKTGSAPYLHPEMLTLLFPLHHTLLPPLHYLTTTSLLPVEKHLLSASLINILLFASAPQATVLRALLWLGGLCLMVFCTHVLGWNVALARVPQWRFRHAAATTARSKQRLDCDSITTTVRGLIFPSRRSQHVDSDADDDAGDLEFARTNLFLDALSPTPFETSQNAALDPNNKPQPAVRQRRHTIASLGDHTSSLKGYTTTSERRKQRRDRTWYFNITPEGALLRKWSYAIYVYACVACIIFAPIRTVISAQAFAGGEPILWALDYLFGDLIILYRTHGSIVESAKWLYISFLQGVKLHLLSSNFSVSAMRQTFGEANTRLLVMLYLITILILGLLTVLSLSASIEVDTRRKIFHATIVTMLLPSTFVDPCFTALALALVLAIFLLLEVLRAGQIPPLGAAIGRFIAPYVDGRDLRGPMVVSHVFLLTGCAIPLWLSLAGIQRSSEGRWPGWETRNAAREVAMVSGVVCVGMGDAAASLVGRRYGRRKWPWIGGKSLEGSAAFALAVMVGLLAAKAWLYCGGWSEVRGALEPRSSSSSRGGLGFWGMEALKALACGCGASFMEAVLTGANDNVVVPVALWLLVKGLRV